MAGFKKNIEKPIQQGLDARVNAMGSYGDSTVLRSNLLGPAKTTNEFALTYEDQVNKNPFVRMISPGSTSTQILYGMFNIEDGPGITKNDMGVNIDNPDFFKSLDDRVGGPENVLYGSNKEQPGYLKPKAGIKDVSIEYQSFGGAVRKATVNWTCFTLEDLSKYQRGSFLSIGRSVILDWGWVRGSKGINGAPKLVQVDDTGQLKLDSKLFQTTIVDVTDESTGEVSQMSEPATWNTLYLSQFGDWSGLLGTVSKFNWTMRDDGGFDCTTELLAKGANIFESEIKTKKSGASTAGTAPDGGLPTEKQLMDEMLEFVKSQELGPTAPFDPVPPGPTLNISERIDTLDLEILSKYFSEDIGEVDKDPKLVVADNHCIVAMLTPPADVGSGVELYEKGMDEDGNETGLERVAEYGKDIWVSWGWFEDNIISYYTSNIVNKVGDEERRAAEFRSVIYDATVTEGDSGHDGRGTIHTAGQRMSHVKQTPVHKFKSMEIRNDIELWTYDPRTFILPGQFPSRWCQVTPQEGRESTEEQDEVWFKLAKAFEEMKDMEFASNDQRTRGYLRNIFLNVGHIQKIFSKPGGSIQSNMLRLAESLNSKIDVWNFELGMHDAGDKTSLYNSSDVCYFIHETTGDGDESESTEIVTADPSESYVFENYGFNSLISSMDIKCDVPDKMAMQAGYGASKSETPGNVDPVKKFLATEKKTDGEKRAEALGEFFANPDNASLIQTIQRPAGINTDFGLGGKRNEKAIGMLSDGGLRNDGEKFNHSIDEKLQDLQPPVKENMMKKFMSKYKDSRTSLNTTIGKMEDGTEVSLGKNVMALPNAYSRDDVENDENYLVEYRKPYDLDGNMRPHFLKSMRWVLEDSPLTSVATTTSTLTMPVSVGFDLEGCGGLFPGHMFRLAYLPDVYGQVTYETKPNTEGSNTDSTKEFKPKSFFTIMGLSHKIDTSGWTTSIEGVLNKVTDEDAVYDSKLTTEEKEMKKKYIRSLRRKYSEIMENYKDPTPGTNE